MIAFKAFDEIWKIATIRDSGRPKPASYRGRFSIASHPRFRCGRRFPRNFELPNDSANGRIAFAIKAGTISFFGGRADNLTQSAMEPVRAISSHDNLRIAPAV
jgi:hypothetical protein